MMIPLFLDLRGWTVVVYGAGPVGRRKAAYLAAEASVLIVDRSPVPEIEGIDFVQGDARDHLDLIDRAHLVVAATDDPSVNDMICERAMALGVHFNRADAPGSFLIPSIVRRRNFTVAVSTEGRSPAMSKHLRERLEAALPPVLEDMVDLTEEMRGELRKRTKDPSLREGMLRTLVEDDGLWQVLAEDREKAMELARRMMGV